jgi:hypothetical protein
MSMNVRRPPSNVQAERLKGGGRFLSAFPTAGQQALPMERVSEKMPKSNLPRTATGDPLLGLVEDRFRLLRHCPACDDQNDDELFDRRLDEIKRRVRRLDERIVRTVATSSSGLLAQLRLLAAFYEESANGAGRRGSLLIQAIAEGVMQLESRRSQPPKISTGLGMSASTVRP